MSTTKNTVLAITIGVAAQAAIGGGLYLGYYGKQISPEKQQEVEKLVAVAKLENTAKTLLAAEKFMADGKINRVEYKGILEVYAKESVEKAVS